MTNGDYGITKTDLVERLAERVDITKAEAGRAVNALFGSEGIIASALARKKRVQIMGFGTFEAPLRKARRGRNPSTGETIRIPATRAPSFRAGKSLKDAVK